RQHAAKLGQVFEPEHADDALDLAGTRGVDRHDPRVGMNAPDQHEMQRAGQPQVVHVSTLPVQKPAVFLPLHRRADHPHASTRIIALWYVERGSSAGFARAILISGRQRVMLPTHGRYDYSNITRRPDYSWPDGKRLAVYVALNIEAFAFGVGKGAAIA